MVIGPSLHRKVVSCNTMLQKASNTCSRCVLPVDATFTRFGADGDRREVCLSSEKERGFISFSDDSKLFSIERS